MRNVVLFSAVLLTFLGLRFVAAADTTASDEEEQMTLAGGPWHAGPNVPCADGIVTSVHSRLEEPAIGGHSNFGSGVVVEFKMPTRPRFLNGQALSASAIVHYDHEHGNSLMQSERTGDKVQVCFIGFPTPTHDPQTGHVICDPNADPRGLMFRVYDYRRHGAFMGPDSQHGCGGA